MKHEEKTTMADNKEQLIEADSNAPDKKRGRGGSGTLFSSMSLLAGLVGLIASMIAAIGIDQASVLVATRIPTSVVVAISIGVGASTIVYVAAYRYRRQAVIRLAAIEKLREIERDFFTGVENEISALFSETVV